jgi:hypothetical protein
MIKITEFTQLNGGCDTCKENKRKPGGKSSPEQINKMVNIKIFHITTNTPNKTIRFCSSCMGKLKEKLQKI